jgi:hypothetical protein
MTTIQKSSTAAPAKKVAVKATTGVSAKPVAKTTLSATSKPAAKTVTPVKVAPKPAAAKAEAKVEKVKKAKLVRDSLTMPKAEYEVLESLKLRAIKLGYPIKKTELIRAGIKSIAAMSDAAFLAAIKAVPSLKTGRPNKE